jgi:hypothetical protein
MPATYRPPGYRPPAYSPPSYGFPSLTPTYGLGSCGRTAAAVLISSPRTVIGSQGRCYAYAKRTGRGQEYIQFLLKSLGPQPTVRNPLSLVTL